MMAPILSCRDTERLLVCTQQVSRWPSVFCRQRYALPKRSGPDSS